MQLVGATDWFIRWPFVIEGLVVGLFGAAIAVGILFLGKVTIVDPLSDNFALVENLNTIAFGPLIAALVVGRDGGRGARQRSDAAPFPAHLSSRSKGLPRRPRSAGGDPRRRAARARRAAPGPAARGRRADAAARRRARHRGLLLPGDRRRRAPGRVDPRHGPRDQRAERRPLLPLLRPGDLPALPGSRPRASSPGSASTSSSRSAACAVAQVFEGTPAEEAGIERRRPRSSRSTGESIGGHLLDRRRQPDQGPARHRGRRSPWSTAKTGKRRELEVERANVQIPAVESRHRDASTGARSPTCSSCHLQPRRPRRAPRGDRRPARRRRRGARLRPARQRRRPARRGGADRLDLPGVGPGRDDRGPRPAPSRRSRRPASAIDLGRRSRSSSTATPPRPRRSSPPRCSRTTSATVVGDPDLRQGRLPGGDRARGRRSARPHGRRVPDRRRDLDPRQGRGARRAGRRRADGEPTATTCSTPASTRSLAELRQS